VTASSANAVTGGACGDRSRRGRTAPSPRLIHHRLVSRRCGRHGTAA
jgi:hypothetical protein